MPEDRSAKASNWLFENKPTIGNRQIEEQIQDLRDVVGQVVDLLSTILPMIQPLDDGETLTYLHGCASWSRIQVLPPDEMQLLDSFLYDTYALPGLEPMLGDRWIKMLAIQSNSGATGFNSSPIMFLAKRSCRQGCERKRPTSAMFFGSRQSSG